MPADFKKARLLHSNGEVPSAQNTKEWGTLLFLCVSPGRACGSRYPA
jgi:hypothetical protein